LHLLLLDLYQYSTGGACSPPSCYFPVKRPLEFQKEIVESKFYQKYITLCREGSGKIHLHQKTKFAVITTYARRCH
jgi:hypothetical protein